MPNLPVYRMFTLGTVETVNRREDGKTLSSWPDDPRRCFTLELLFQAMQLTMKSMSVKFGERRA